MPSNNEILMLISAGSIRNRDLPDYLPLNDFGATLESFWEQAFQDQVEYGCCIVANDNTLHLPQSHRKKGGQYFVDPACSPEDEVPEHRLTYVGFVHTHPNIHKKPYPDPGFSASDFFASVVDGDCLALVCNSEEVFALVRCWDRTLPRQGITLKDRDEWENLYHHFMKSESISQNQFFLSKTILEFNKIMCEKTGYALYSSPRKSDELALIYRPNSGVLQA